MSLSRISEDFNELKEVNDTEKKIIRELKKDFDLPFPSTVNFPEGLDKQVVGDIKEVVEINNQLVGLLDGDEGVFEEYYIATSYFSELRKVVKNSESDLRNIEKYISQLENRNSGLDDIKGNELKWGKHLASVIQKLEKMFALENKIGSELTSDLEEAMQNEIRNKVSESQKRLEEKSTFLIEMSELEKFLPLMNRVAVDEKSEAGGFFQYQKTDSGIHLTQFFKAKNTSSGDSSFLPPDDLMKMYSEKKEEEKFITTHCHPHNDYDDLTRGLSVGDSDMLSDYGGVIDGETFELLVEPYKPEIHKSNKMWILVSKTNRELHPIWPVKEGKLLPKSEVKQKVPNILRYNEAIIKASAMESNPFWYLFVEDGHDRYHQKIEGHLKKWNKYQLQKKTVDIAKAIKVDSTKIV